ncbi:hypothetical protein [Jannaschia sp. 2305UL9-9]|uniref:hypothetical protein n=1 Tax=Jannaschia sp. 2305UL9-9 TaxID=3121638 RepID=UPI003527A86F
MIPPTLSRAHHRVALLCIGLSVLMAAGCAASLRNPVASPELYLQTDAPVPFAVRSLLPRGVIESDVRVRDNCYGYASGGVVYPVLNPRGTQYCI